MGLNEQPGGWFDEEEPAIDDNPIIEDIKHIRMSEDDKVVISMTLNVMISGEDGKDTMGKITVISEWVKNPKMIIKLIDIKSTVPLSDMWKKYIISLFSENTNIDQLLTIMYRPLYSKFIRNEEYTEKIRLNFLNNWNSISKAIDNE